jgi:hypothetical protein
MNLITAMRTVAIVIFGYGVGWSMAEFDTQVPPLSSCLSPVRFGEATRRGVRPGVYHPTGLVRRRADPRSAAATRPSAGQP